ncbi:unnamed protein product [Rangifer tarandus platyrhynchus]|uniref:Uncharacterized protein n=1 Tax=Rangifer tarandus platyrhynchus TaxID=3082113 RepID=A0ACB1KFF4_RANTA
MLAPHSTRKRSEADPTNFTLPSLILGGQATWRVDAWLDLTPPPPTGGDSGLKQTPPPPTFKIPYPMGTVPLAV